jgi:DNA polymerase alpha subunit B
VFILLGCPTACSFLPKFDFSSCLHITLNNTCSFFPVYPAPLGTCLDLTTASSALELALTPHILLLPSDLGAFAKVVTVPNQLMMSTANSSSNQQGTGLGPGAVGASPAPAAPHGGGASGGANGVSAAGAAGTQQQTLPPQPPSVVCINPGRLARGTGGGTYALVSVVPGEGASIAGRCRVEIRRV